MILPIFMNNEPCVFCSVIEKNIPCHEIVWSDSEHAAFLDAFPKAKGHTLVVPRLHVADMLDMTEERVGKLFVAAQRVSKMLQKTTGSKRVALLVEGFTVPHVHVHLIPVSTGREIQEWKTFDMAAADFRSFAEKLRAEAGRNAGSASI